MKCPLLLIHGSSYIAQLIPGNVGKERDTIFSNSLSVVVFPIRDIIATGSSMIGDKKRDDKQERVGRSTAADTHKT
jgi:hypothetical protein